MTHSQEIVLKEGILFAREPVLRYQKLIENAKEIFGGGTKEDEEYDGTQEVDHDDEYMQLPIPSNYGKMLQKLLEDKVIFPTDRNENG